MCCDRTAAASAPHDSATRFRGGSRKSPFPSSQGGSGFWDLANPFPRINTCAAITILTAAWKPWLYCTVFRIPYFSGRKSTIHTHASLTQTPNFVIRQARLVFRGFHLRGVSRFRGSMAEISYFRCDVRLHRSPDMVHLDDLGRESRLCGTFLFLHEGPSNIRSRGTCTPSAW